MIPAQRRYSDNIFDPEPTFRLARQPLPQRHRGLAADQPLPAECDLSRLQALMRELAPAGWSTDVVAMERAMLALIASMGTNPTAGGGDSMTQVSEPRRPEDEQPTTEPTTEPERDEDQDTQASEDARDERAGE